MLELVNFSPRDSDSDSRHKSLDSDSKPAGLGLESYASGLGLETCGLGLDSDSRKRGLVASLLINLLIFSEKMSKRIILSILVKFHRLSTRLTEFEVANIIIMDTSSWYASEECDFNDFSSH